MKTTKRNDKKAMKHLGKVGKSCEILENVELGSEPYLINLGDNVKMSSGVKLLTHDGGAHVLRNIKNENRDIDIIGSITIKNNVFIGINSIIMPGVTIGNNVIVGAGSIVTKSVPDNSVVAGIPAKIVCTIEEYQEKRKDNFLNTKSMDEETKKKYLLKQYNENPEQFLKR